MSGEQPREDGGIYDYIVVGAGSGGCALAGRLAQRPDVRVLVIEAGPEDDHFLIHMPKGFPFLTRNLRYAWNFMTEPQPHRNFGQEMWPRGRMLGGSSSINGMLYSRGHPADYEAWEAAGAAGWTSSEVLKSFMELEDHELGASETRGAGGPLHVSPGARRSDISELMIEAGEQMGLPRSQEMFAPTTDRVGYVASTTLRGRRFSAARAHLRPLKGRANIRVVTETEVDKVLFEGKRAVGVKARGPAGEIIYRARREIIVSAGAILSPKLLQLSGIGDAAALRAKGVEVVHDNPHVGGHMRDHVGVSIPYRLHNARGLNHMLRFPGLAYTLMRYALFNDGILATAGEVGAFVRANPNSTRPDSQLMILSLSQDLPRPGRFMGEIERLPGFVAMGCTLNATSEGTISLASPDPRDNPLVQPNALATDYDKETSVGIVKYIRRMLSQPALKGLVGEARQPWQGASTDTEILDVVLKGARNFNHAVGTCRMGREGEGVLDERLRVRGVSGLRVADCSSMPTLPAGNTNGPAQMVGWRAAKLILEDADKINSVEKEVVAAHN